MALQIVSLETLEKNLKSKKTDPQIVEILEAHNDHIVKMYKDKNTVTSIVNTLNNTYEGQLEKVEVRKPTKKGEKAEYMTVEPKVSALQIKKILVKSGVMTQAEADFKRKRKTDKDKEKKQ